MKNDTGGSAAPHTKHNIVLMDKGDNIPDYQKVIGKLSAFNHIQFVRQAFFDFSGGIGIKARKRIITKVRKILIRRFTRRQFYFRQMKPFKIKFEVAHLCNFMGIFERVRDIAVSFGHFVRSFQIKEITLHLHPFLVGDNGVGADT